MAGKTKADYPVALENTPGYTGLLDTLDNAIASCVNQNSRMALLVIDLSRIEMLNPVLGYRKTSDILDAVQTRLLDIKRPSDILSRISDHRFALIIPDLKFSTMIDLAVNRIIESIDGLRSFTGMEATIYPRTGVALFPDNGHTAQELLLGADTAAQATPGADTWVVHAGSPLHENIYQSKLMAAELEPAFMQSRLELYYQPKVNLVSRQLYGAEALIRWKHPKYGNISPNLLISLIEKSHLLQEITLWILNTALHQSKLMRARSPDFRIAVNLSPDLLASPDLVELVTRALRIWNTDPHLLILEVTETSMMVNQEISEKNLQQLSDVGVLLSIDDFGTGYSSYSYLQKLPVQELKIDMSFITDLLIDKNSECLVRSMINLGGDLGINVLAEGIETPETMERLVNMGCQYGQGFLISQPLPVAEMLEWIDSSGWEKPPDCS
jgi:EAL domain-containing protein (putative c-di-GMP-specific phosphodiesterase class I)/GGDEF domain-containing protein